MRFMLKKNNGITLVALVVTIIILLILAGITITALTSDNGLLKKTDEAKTQTDIAREKEGIMVSVVTTKMNKEEFNETANTEFQNQLDNYFGSGECVSEYDGEENVFIVIFENGRKYTVDEDGSVIQGIYEKWDGTTAQEPTEKTSNEIHIYTPAELKWLSDQVNAGNTFEGYTVYLENNLDLSARKTGDTWDTEANKNVEWTAIGNSPTIRLKATFEGKEHTIKGVYINKPDEDAQGIFGVAKEIKDLTVKDSYIHGKTYTGGIAGVLYNTEITNCHNLNTEIIGEDCYTSGVIGAVAGATATEFSINSCSNTGSVTGKGDFTAGIVSFIYTGKIYNVFNSGVITGVMYAGGIVGYAENIELDNCYNKNTVTGEKCVGGMAGTIVSGTVKNCYNEAKISATIEQAGGIVGAVAKETTIESCYNLKEIYSVACARRNCRVCRTNNNDQKIF